MLPVLLKTDRRQGGISGDHLRSCVRLNPIAPPVGKKSVHATAGRPAVDEIEHAEKFTRRFRSGRTASSTISISSAMSAESRYGESTYTNCTATPISAAKRVAQSIVYPLGSPSTPHIDHGRIAGVPTRSIPWSCTSSRTLLNAHHGINSARTLGPEPPIRTPARIPCARDHTHIPISSFLWREPGQPLPRVGRSEERSGPAKLAFTSRTEQSSAARPFHLRFIQPRLVALAP